MKGSGYDGDRLSRLRRRAGFTLVELLVVILIIGILLAIAAPSFLGQTQKASNSAAEQYLAIAYREAAADAVSHDGDFGGPTDGLLTEQTVADAINAGEGGLLFAEPGACPADASSDPKHIIVSQAASGDLTLCNAVPDGSEHTVWTLTVVDHVLQPLTSATQTGTGIGAPKPTVAPSLSSNGSLAHVQVGDVLHVANGTWINDPTGFSYQWQRSADGSNWSGAAGAGATSADYTVDLSDLGDYVRVVVTGSNQGGDRAVTTTAVGPVLPATPVNDSGDPPAISDADQPGGALDHVQVGDQLLASAGSWSSSPTSYAYQWQRSTDGSDWLNAPDGDIAGATASSYTVPAVQEGYYLRVVVQATNAGGTGSASSSATGQVFPATPSNDPGDPPSYSGTVQVGHTLTGDPGTWVPTPTSYSYQWQHSTDGSSWSNASGPGAQTSSYTVDSSDFGDYVQLCVTAANAGGAASACSGVPAGAGAASPSAPLNTAAPAFSGLAQVDQTLHVSDGTWSSQDPSLTYSYQWQSSPDGSNWSDIAAATAADYTIVQGDLGNELRAVVTAHDSYGGTSSATTDPSSAVQASVPVGAVVAYAGASVPTGWLLANGQAVDRTSYADLYAVEGTAYGAGDGSTTFNLPNLAGRFPLGQSASGTGATLGAAGGSLDMGGGAISLPATGALSFTTPVTTFSDGAVSAQTPTGFSFPTHTTYQYWASDTEMYGATVGAGGALSSGWASFNMPAQAASGASVMPTATLGTANPAYRVLRYIVKASSSAQAPACAVWGSARSAAPAGATAADGSTASGTLSSCLDSAYAGAAPDLRGRFPLGQSAAGTGATLNGAGGSLDFTQSVSRHVPTTTVTVPNYTAPAQTVPAGNYPVTYNWYYFGQGNGTDGGWIIRCSGGGTGASNTVGAVANPSPNNRCLPANATTPATASSTATGGGGSYTTNAVDDTAQTTAQNPAFQVLDFYTGTTNPASGTVTAFAGASAPAGWLKADGACVSQSSYADLYAAVGSSYGSCVAGQFKLPDLQGRFPLGKASSGTGAALGAAGGSLDIQPQASLANFTPSFTWAPSSFSFTVAARTATLNLGNCTFNTSITEAICDHEYANTYQSGVTANSTNVFTGTVAGTGFTATASSQSVSGTATGATTATFAPENPAYQVFLYIVKT